jgi:nicotinamidase-related amidase
MKISREQTACLVIDIQERLVPVIHEKEALLKNCGILIEGLQALGIPMLVSQQYTKGLGETVPEISSLFSDFGFIEKRDFSCCGEPEVMLQLNMTGAKNIIVCGIESHVCVLQTVLDLQENGFNPIVVTDAMSSRTPYSIEIAKERFRYEGVLMTSVESLLFELTRSSAAPGFKVISKLVK